MNYTGYQFYDHDQNTARLVDWGGLDGDVYSGVKEREGMKW